MTSKYYPTLTTCASFLALVAAIAIILQSQPASRFTHHDDDYSYMPRLRTRTPPSLPPPTQTIRDLTWGNVQFLHTTDIHGWFTPHHSPHAPSNSFSADWGHWVDFIGLMRERARREGRDLVLVDSGDLVTGHGLSDGEPGGGQVKGHYSNGIFAMADYDILTIGNHELYSLETLDDMQRSFIPRYKGRYLTSNTNLSSTPIGDLYHSYVLRQTKLRITSLGFLFNFPSPHPDRITIQPPLEMMQSDWFSRLMHSDVARETDIWLLAGHMPLDGEEDEWKDVIRAMRLWESVGNKTIVALAGHTHIRNCRRVDPQTIVLQSGRFHETAGWVSINVSTTQTPTFSRKYIDLNPRNLAHHAGVSIANLSTAVGQSIRTHMARLTEDWDLNHVHGFAPRDLYLDKVDSSDAESILQGVRDVLRRVFVDGEEPAAEKSSAALVVLNSGSMRSDIRAGPFTTNDQYIVSPFSDSFYVLPAVPYELAAKVLPLLNGEQDSHEDGRELRYATQRNFSQVYPSPSLVPPSGYRQDTDGPTEGYVTRDECGEGNDGDDTVHTPITVRPFEPPYVGFLTKPSSSHAQTDIITVKYLLPRIVDLLNGFIDDNTTAWATTDARLYRDAAGLEVKTRDLWKREAQEVWAQPVRGRDVWV